MIDNLRAITTEWNDLWERSGSTSAIHRAESLLCFGERFTQSDVGIRVFTVRGEDHRLLAAIPLVETRRLLGLSVGGLPGNEWSQPGMMLVDRTVDSASILTALVEAIQEGGFSLVRLDQLDLDSPDVAELEAALAKKKVPYETVFQYDTGMVDVRGDFESLISARSKNLRSTLRRRRRRLEEQGKLRFTMFDRFSPLHAGQPLEPLFRKMFELERKSWKRTSGGTVLDNPGVFDFYVELGHRMSEGGFLRVAILEHNDRLIAYDLAIESKRVYHSYKVSYDPEFQRYAPGQLLHEEILRHACGLPTLDTLVFCGPMDAAIVAWSTESHRLAHLSFSPHRLLWLAYRTLATIRRLGH